MMQRIESVIFDWGGTLTPWHVVDTAACWAATVGPGEVAERLRVAEDAVLVRSRDVHRSATLAEVESMAAISLTESQRVTYFSWWEAFAALAERGLKVGVLSNTIWPRAQHESWFRRDGVLDFISGAVYTCEIEWTKPHPEAFRAALAAVGGSEPQRSVFVGDRLFDDIHGAKAVGMRAVFVPHSDIPPWQTTGVVGTPDAVITDLSQLVGHIDRWLDEDERSATEGTAR